jgi:hypothetical protein
VNIVDRFTRDRVSRFLWGGLTISFALLLVFAFSGEREAVREQERGAQASAVRSTETTLFQNLNEELVSGPILRQQDHAALLIPVQAEIMTNENVARVRLFGVDGALLFSTDEGDQTGTATLEESVPLNTAIGGETTSVLIRAGSVPSDGLAASNEDLYQTYVPIRVAGRTAIVGAAEIDARHGLLVEAALSPWRLLEVVFGVGLLLFLGLTVLSYRRSRTMNGVDLEALVKPPRADPGGDDPAELRHELAEARSQLRQAEEAYRFLEARSKTQGGEPLPASELAELRAALSAAEASGDQARAQIASSGRALAGARVRELEEELMQEHLRRANAERAARDAEEAAQTVGNRRIQELEMEVRTLRERVSGEDPADAIRADLDLLRHDLESARAELDAARAQLHAKHAELDAKQAELDAARAQLDSARVELGAKHTELDAKHTELDARHAELRAKQAELDATKAEAERANQELAEERAAKRDEHASDAPSRQPRARSGKQETATTAVDGDRSQPAVSEAQTTDQPQPAASEAQTTDQPQPAASEPQTTDQPQPAASEPQTTDQPQPAASEPQRTEQREPAASEPQRTEQREPAARDQSPPKQARPRRQAAASRIKTKQAKPGAAEPRQKANQPESAAASEPPNSEEPEVAAGEPQISEQPDPAGDDPHPTPDDPAEQDLRARLVRTAARKKPAPDVYEDS